MNVITMRQCVRCGSSFRPLDLNQVCCSDVCSLAVQNLSLVRVRPAPPVVTPKPLLAAPSRGRRGPIFVGARFVVFEWQVEQLARMLGPLVDNFDLEEWFFALDARMMNSAEVVPQRDGGQWLQARTLEEAQRRGLPVAISAQTPSAGKQTSRLAQAIANIKGKFQ